MSYILLFSTWVFIFKSQYNLFYFSIMTICVGNINNEATKGIKAKEMPLCQTLDYWLLHNHSEWRLKHRMRTLTSPSQCKYRYLLDILWHTSKYTTVGGMKGSGFHSPPSWGYSLVQGLTNLVLHPLWLWPIPASYDHAMQTPEAE